MAFPLLTSGYVINHAPDEHGVMVMLKTGETPSRPVLVGTHGANDALRVNHGPMPGRGTWGLIAFPHGDDRNGVWLTSYPGNLIDAYTAGPADTAIEYAAHFAGGWEHKGQDGSTTEVWPDGSSLVVGNEGAVPATYRHTLDEKGNRQRVVLTQAERIAQPPAPFPRVYTHASGATTTISAEGVVTEYSASGQVINVGAVGDTLYRLIDERIINYYNNHTHGNVQNGGGNTAVPNVQITVMEVATQHLHAG